MRAKPRILTWAQEHRKDARCYHGRVNGSGGGLRAKMPLYSTRLRVRQLGYQQFLALREGAEVIEADHFGEKVLRLRDGSFLKLFRRKRLISSAAWYPYAQRFADNAGALAERGIPCPQIISVFRQPELGRDAVHYRPLEGNTVRQLLEANLTEKVANALRHRIGAFVAELHRKGVYFRSLHFGNIVETQDGRLGLIDIADLTTKRRALGALHRRRNIQHLYRYESDAAWLKANDSFQQGYRQA